MTKLVRPNEEAEEEFRYYIRRYESESIGLGDRLWTEIQTAIALISVYPSIGQTVPRVRAREKVRRIPLGHFPFLLVYREYPDHLEVIALAHTSRDPKYWRRRLE